MAYLYHYLAAGRRSLFFLLWLLAALPGRAQAPVWSGVAYGSGSQGANSSFTNAVAADAQGNVFVTGLFEGTLTFGSTTLTSAGGTDIFVAKYVPATDTWAWAQSGGGTGSDIGRGIAVSGSSVYVTGYFTNSSGNSSNVLFGGAGPTSGTTQLNGVGSSSSVDIVLLKYTDNGSSATLRWTQVGGSAASDQGVGVAASGNSVYLVGQFGSPLGGPGGAVFGGSGTTAGTTMVNAATSPANGTDLVLAKYTDNGPTATLGWTQVAGGTANDAGYAVAVSGSSVYVTGFITNDQTNSYGVVFGGGGTTAGLRPQAGASPQAGSDLVLAKYTDNGATASFRWSQVGGGTGYDFGRGVAASGNSVYVTGTLTNNAANASAVLFGGAGTTAGATPVNGATTNIGQDLLLVKYTDQGNQVELGWTQVAGGLASESGDGVAVSGSSVYVTGTLVNDAANTEAVVFGGGGTTLGTSAQVGATATTSQDLVLAKYTDNGATASYRWSQVGGGPRLDNGYGVAVSGQRVLVAGSVQPPATLGSATVPGSTTGYVGILTRLADPTLTPLSARVIAPVGAGMLLVPNPAGPYGAASLSGAAPNAAVQVLDALGRVAATATTNAEGTTTLSKLAPGLYLVRAGSATARLAVE